MKEKIESYIKTWEKRCYKYGIPGEVDQRLEVTGKVPTYRRICKAILCNDITLSSLGYTRPKCEAYNVLKKEELKARGMKISIQLSLF